MNDKMQFREMVLTAAVVGSIGLLGWLVFASSAIPTQSTSGQFSVDSQLSKPAFDAPATAYAPSSNSIEETTNLANVPVTWLEIGSLKETVSLSENPQLSTIDKIRWSQANGKAQMLLNRICDCDQVNFLTHFMKCAAYASQNDPKFTAEIQCLKSLPLEN